MKIPADVIYTKLPHKADIVNMMPNPLLCKVSPDVAIVNAARTSFLGESKGAEADKKLLTYLYKHHHTSPFEMAEVLYWWDYTAAGLKDDVLWALLDDPRYHVTVYRLWNNLVRGAYVRIDANNAIKFMQNQPEHPFTEVLKLTFQLALPWTAEAMGLEPLAEVTYPTKPREYPRRTVLNNDKLWLELQGWTADDHALGALLAATQHELLVDFDPPTLIEAMFKSGDLRILSLFSVKMMVRAPVVTLWQWVRHRSMNFSLQSGRYMPFKEDDLYIPDILGWRKQSDSNKQGSDGILNTFVQATTLDDMYENNHGDDSVTGFINDIAWIEDYSELLSKYGDLGHFLYTNLLESGAAKEQARLFLPAWGSLYTAVIKTDLMMLLRFLRLRLDPHAQEEIRAYAEVLYQAWAEVMPITARLAQQYAFEKV